jgi:hypothetical protein
MCPITAPRRTSTSARESPTLTTATIVKLTHGGVTRNVIDRPGTPAPAGFNNDGFNGSQQPRCFSTMKASAEPLKPSTSRAASSPPSYTPNQSLGGVSGFDGQDRFGVWTLDRF